VSKSFRLGVGLKSNLFAHSVTEQGHSTYRSIWLPRRRAADMYQSIGLLNSLKESNMAVYQCFFFSGGLVRNWENIECDGSMPLTAALRGRLKNGRWRHAEAWSNGKLVCEVRRSRPTDEGASKLASNHSVLRLAE
jgi:hypothetical protein